MASTTKTPETVITPPAYDPKAGLMQNQVQTGVGGKANQDINLGLNPGLMDYATDVYNTTPFGNQNYDVAAGSSRAAQAQAFTRKAQQDEMSAQQLNQMLGSNSPLMRRAAQHAMAGAAGRGLMNSSIAVGNAQGEMIDRAQPFALQDAQAHGKAASESLANQQAAANLNAQLQTESSISNAGLMTQAGMASMNARATRDRDFRQGALGGRQDVARHALGMENREDQQEWQKIENDTNRDWGTKEREGGQEFQDRQARLTEAFQWGLGRQEAAERWAEGELTILANQGLAKYSAMGQIASSIFGNPDLTSAEQNAAWESAKVIMDDTWDRATGQPIPRGPAADQGNPNAPATPATPTTPEGPTVPHGVNVTTTAQPASRGSTTPSASPATVAQNEALGQTYASATNPKAEATTAALPALT